MCTHKAYSHLMCESIHLCIFFGDFLLIFHTCYLCALNATIKANKFIIFFTHAICGAIVLLLNSGGDQLVKLSFFAYNIQKLKYSSMFLVYFKFFEIFINYKSQSPPV